MEKRQGQPSRRERGTNGQEHRTGKSGSGTDEDRGRRWRRPSRTQTFWILFVLGLILAAKFLGSMPSDERVISYKEYRDYLKAGQITQGVVVGQDEFHGVLRDDERFAYVAAWEWNGPGAAPILHKEPLAFEYVSPSTRSYK